MGQTEAGDGHGATSLGMSRERWNENNSGAGHISGAVRLR
jgi:hypothetical protein